MLLRDKHSSLVVESFNDKDEKFYNFCTDRLRIQRSSSLLHLKVRLKTYFGATTLSIKTISIKTLSIKTLSIKTLSIKTFSIKTLSIKAYDINDTSHLVRHIGLFSKHFPH